MQHMTREEFHRRADGRKGCFERIAGEPVAISPEQAQHVRLKACIWAALDNASDGLDCEAIGDGIGIEIGDDSDYEPDAVVNRGPAMHPDATFATNPVAVVEVPSPGTQSIDTTDKLADYFRVPSIHHNLIVRARRQEIIHHHRQADAILSRTFTLGSIGLDPPGLSLDIANVSRA